MNQRKESTKMILGRRILRQTQTSTFIAIPPVYFKNISRDEIEAMEISMDDNFILIMKPIFKDMLNKDILVQEGDVHK